MVTADDPPTRRVPEPVRPTYSVPPVATVSVPLPELRSTTPTPVGRRPTISPVPPTVAVPPVWVSVPVAYRPTSSAAAPVSSDPPASV